MRAPQFFRTGTGHRIGRKPLAAPFTPQISFMQDMISTLNPFTFVTALLFARPTELTRPERHYDPPALRGFYFRAFRPPGRPACLPDITTALN